MSTQNPWIRSVPWNENEILPSAVREVGELTVSYDLGEIFFTLQNGHTIRARGQSYRNIVEILTKNKVWDLDSYPDLSEERYIPNLMYKAKPLTRRLDIDERVRFDANIKRTIEYENYRVEKTSDGFKKTVTPETSTTPESENIYTESVHYTILEREFNEDGSHKLIPGTLTPVMKVKRLSFKNLASDVEMVDDDGKLTDVASFFQTKLNRSTPTDLDRFFDLPNCNSNFDVRRGQGFKISHRVLEDIWAWGSNTTNDDNIFKDRLLTAEAGRDIRNKFDDLRMYSGIDVRSRNNILSPDTLNVRSFRAKSNSDLLIFTSDRRSNSNGRDGGRIELHFSTEKAAVNIKGATVEIDRDILDIRHARIDRALHGDNVRHRLNQSYQNLNNSDDLIVVAGFTFDEHGHIIKIHERNLSDIVNTILGKPTGSKTQIGSEGTSTLDIYAYSHFRHFDANGFSAVYEGDVRFKRDVEIDRDLIVKRNVEIGGATKIDGDVDINGDNTTISSSNVDIETPIVMVSSNTKKNSLVRYTGIGAFTETNANSNENSYARGKTVFSIYDTSPTGREYVSRHSNAKYPINIKKAWYFTESALLAGNPNALNFTLPDNDTSDSDLVNLVADNFYGNLIGNAKSADRWDTDSSFRFKPSTGYKPSEGVKSTFPFVKTFKEFAVSGINGNKESQIVGFELELDGHSHTAKSLPTAKIAKGTGFDSGDVESQGVVALIERLDFEMDTTNEEQGINYALHANAGKTLAQMIDLMFPIGSILPMTCEMKDLDSRLFVAAIGGNLTRTHYKGLFDVYGVKYGVGNGTTTFGIPDMRGRYMGGIGADGIELGKSYGDQFRSHGHTVNNTIEYTITDHKHITPWGERWASHARWGVWSAGGQGRIGSGRTDWDNWWFYTSPQIGGELTKTGSISISAAGIDGPTRPKTFGVNWVIKIANVSSLGKSYLTPLPAPTTPSVSNITGNSVRVTGATGTLVREGINGVLYNSPHTFEGLSPMTTYTFYAVRPRTTTNEQSPNSMGVSATTTKGIAVINPLTVQSQTPRIGTVDITLVPQDGAKYRLNGGAWQDSNIFTGIQPNTTCNFSAYKPATTTTNASDVVNLSIISSKANQLPPAKPTVKAITGDSITFNGDSTIRIRQGMNGELIGSPFTFNELASGSTYDFYAVKIATAAFNQSSNSEVTSVTTSSAPQKAPTNPPIVSEITSTSCFVSVISDDYMAMVRLGADGELFTPPRRFEGLTPNTQYTFYSVYPEMSGMLDQSPNSPGVTITTLKGAQTINPLSIQSQIPRIGTVDITLVPQDGAKYRLNGGAWQDSNTFNVQPNTTCNFAAYKPANAQGNATAEVTLSVTSVKANQLPPDANSVTVSAIEHNSITINGAGDKMIRMGVTGELSNLPRTFTGLNAGTEYSFYTVFKETATLNQSPNSVAIMVTTQLVPVNVPTTGTISDSEIEVIGPSGTHVGMK